MKLPNSFRWTGYLEGLSFLVLLFIAMPLKYIWDMPSMVRTMGTAHGILFLIYVGAATYFAVRENWKKPALLYAYIASVIPFGPFLFDTWAVRRN